MRALCIRQHDLRSVDKRTTAVEMVGDRARIPLAIGPTGLAGLTWANGEAEAAKAAAAFGVPYCLSTMSICSIEDVAQATGKPFWFQLYLMKEQRVNESLVHRAEKAGCSAMVLTLDLHVQGKRWADAKNGLSVPPKITPGNALDVLRHLGWLVSMARSKRRTFGNLQDEVKQAGNLSALAEWIEAQFDPSFDADTVRWLRGLWKRKLILKGVMHPDDARAAIDLGADAIIVSNHGGRQLDGAQSSITALPPIADAVGDDLTVFMDGGVRSGLDVLKAMALGAKGCFLGRSWAFGLAGGGGEAGVTHVLDIMRGELATALALTGCTDVRKAGRQLLIEAEAALKDAAAAAQPAPAKPRARASRQTLAAE
jgi:L-lactate dehydrogenase (cytochrome)